MSNSGLYGWVAETENFFHWLSSPSLGDFSSRVSAPAWALAAAFAPTDTSTDGMPATQPSLALELDVPMTPLSPGPGHTVPLLIGPVQSTLTGSAVAQPAALCCSVAKKFADHTVAVALLVVKPLVPIWKNDLATVRLPQPAQ